MGYSRYIRLSCTMWHALGDKDISVKKFAAKICDPKPLKYLALMQSVC
jgi:hypothetical protein